MKNAALIVAELTTLFPSDETPRSTEKREGFFHLTSINGMCEKAGAKYIIRDHDKHHFEQRKSMVHAVCDFLNAKYGDCLLYTSDAADDLLCVDLGGRRIIKKKTESKKQIEDASVFFFCQAEDGIRDHA